MIREIGRALLFIGTFSGFLLLAITMWRWTIREFISAYHAYGYWLFTISLSITMSLFLYLGLRLWEYLGWA